MEQITINDFNSNITREREIENIVRENENLVRHTVSTFKKKGWLANYTKTFSDEDVFQIGMIGLFKAAKGFDESKGYKFSTYAVTTIRNTISNELKKNSISTENGYQSYDSFNMAYEEYMEENSSVSSVINKRKPADNRVKSDYEFADLDIEMLFEKLIKMHPKQKNKILQAKTLIKQYGQGYTWIEVAKMNDMSIYQVKKRINDLKEMLPFNLTREHFSE